MTSTDTSQKVRSVARSRCVGHARNTLMLIMWLFVLVWVRTMPTLAVALLSSNMLLQQQHS